MELMISSWSMAKYGMNWRIGSSVYQTKYIFWLARDMDFPFYFRHSDELTQIPGGMVSTVLTYPLWGGEQGANFETIQSFFCKLVLT